MNQETSKEMTNKLESAMSLLDCLEMSVTGLFLHSDCSCEHRVINEIRSMLCEMTNKIKKETF